MTQKSIEELPMSSARLRAELNKKPNGAIFSEDRFYRYVLWRQWDGYKPMVMCIGLNPSTANEHVDDPTIRRLKGLLQKWYGGFFMCNLFAQVTPYPKELLLSKNPIGLNDEWLQQVSRLSDRVIFCWGNFDTNGRAEQVDKMFQAYCFGRNKNGSPKHPLYLPSTTLIEEYT